ncbi:MAG: hypothetical protein K9N51_10990 [Candidatus Pacebacteria bacterium]|nr:hypothetical protein [Candidatus Paceibacterota bacterium]
MDHYAKRLGNVLFLLLIGTVTASAEEALAKDQKVQAGFALVDQFYNALLTDSSVAECPDIFASDALEPAPSDHTPKTVLAERWQFLRANRSLFLTDRYESGEFYHPEDFFSKSRKMIAFFNPPKGKHYTEGFLYITLVSTVARTGADGIYKEIAFPIVPAGTPGEYKIEFLGIKINGVLLDMYGDFERDYDLWNRLGFSREGTP